MASVAEVAQPDQKYRCIVVRFTRPPEVSERSNPMPSSATRRFDEPAIEAALLLNRLGLAILMIAAPLAAVATRRLIFILMPVGAALILLSAMIAPQRTTYHRDSLRDYFLSSAALAALFLGFWAALSLVWTPFTAEASERFFKSLGTALLVALAAGYLPERTRASNLYLLPIGVGLAALATLAAGLFGPPSLRGPAIESSTLDRAVVGEVVLVWPALAALALRERWGVAAALATVTTIAAIAVWTPLALVALIVGALAFALAVSGPERAGKILGGLVAALFVFAPLAAVAAALALDANGFAGSLVAWGALIKQEAIRLLTGHGLGTAARLAGALAPNAPRSLIFETWFELGALGALASAALAWLAFSAAGRLAATFAPFLLAGMAAGLGVTLLGLSTTQLWWLTTIGVVAIGFAVAGRAQYRTRRPKARIGDEDGAARPKL